MNRFWGHLTTITRHKLLVGKLCFDCGLYKQGLLHDLSKYSWVEFSSGVKYFQGNRSPIDKEKEVIGYSKGWLHHKDGILIIGNIGSMVLVRESLGQKFLKSISWKCFVIE